MWGAFSLTVLSPHIQIQWRWLNISSRKAHLTVSDTHVPPTLCFTQFELHFDTEATAWNKYDTDLHFEGWQQLLRGGVLGGWDEKIKDSQYHFHSSHMAAIVPGKMSPQDQEKQLFGFTHTFSGVSIHQCESLSLYRLSVCLSCWAFYKLQVCTNVFFEKCTRKMICNISM